MTQPQPDWDPYSSAASANQSAGYDDQRRRCPVAYSDALGWSLFRHRDVVSALTDDAMFSNMVSAHLSVPNGIDPPQHTEYRRIIDRYFSIDRMEALEPRCQEIARQAVQALPINGELDVMAEFAPEFALQSQCAFLGWPADLHRPLRDWVRKNHAATRSRDRDAMSAVAFEFDRHIRAVLEERRTTGSEGCDVASELLRERLGDRTLNDQEIVSILRNWTVGELATISTCIGILIAFLAEHASMQRLLRAQPSLLPAAIEEILRIGSPLVSSRRRTRHRVRIGGCEIEAGERVTLMWASANRDESTFEHPDEFRLDRNPALNLLYGAGLHVCPGAPLARLELRVLMEELLASVELTPSTSSRPIRAVYPASGFSAYTVRVTKR
ncbi:cytochrome P450 [Peristeroidobacter agariperforans]|uniref:cytochrome P450 n=1 Tax=Peristeroidobacter agariperforans TaxID=268404 RepID=UPI00101E1C2F